MIAKEKVCHDLAVTASRVMFENMVRVQEKISEDQAIFHLLKYYKETFKHLMKIHDSLE